MVSFPRYEKYKDSGVEWLGEIPEHWDLVKVFHDFNLIGSGTTPQSGNYKYYKNGVVPWVNTGDLNNTKLDSVKHKITNKAIQDYSTLKLYPKGTIIVAMYGATIGQAAILNISACTNQACCALGKSKFHEHKFFFYWIIGYKKNIILMGYGGGQPNISQEIIKKRKVPTPPLEEQKRIVEFLDRKTEEIDRAIAHKKRLIELLEEQKTILINQAVTKGLNPNAPMKDSGIEWIGEIPEHWEVKKISRITRVVRGASPRPAGHPRFFSSTDGTPWVTVAEITKDDNVYLNSTQEHLTASGVKQSQFFERGTLLLTNSGATLGVPKILNIDCCANDGVLAFKYLSKNIYIKFLYFYLYSQTFRLREEMKQGSGQPNLNTEIAKNILITVPNLKEQKEIVVFIETWINQKNKLIENMKQGIEKLKELKQILIAEAVTGKIKI